MERAEFEAFLQSQLEQMIKLAVAESRGAEPRVATPPGMPSLAHTRYEQEEIATGQCVASFFQKRARRTPTQLPTSLMPPCF